MFNVKHQWIRLNELYKLVEIFYFFYFEFVFEFLAENWKIFKQIARREYWWKCNELTIYQWIWLNKLYKPMESFFQISNYFLNYWPKTEKYLTNNKVRFMQARWGRHLCWTAHVLVTFQIKMIYLSAATSYKHVAERNVTAVL